MRKVTFIIDDEQYFRNDFKCQNPQLTENQIDNIFYLYHFFQYQQATIH